MLFRSGKFMAALAEAHEQNALPADPDGSAECWNRRKKQLYKHDWVVYAKTPMGGPAAVLSYLALWVAGASGQAGQAGAGAGGATDAGCQSGCC